MLVLFSVWTDALKLFVRYTAQPFRASIQKHRLTTSYLSPSWIPLGVHGGGVHLIGWWLDPCRTRMMGNTLCFWNGRQHSFSTVYTTYWMHAQLLSHVQTLCNPTDCSLSSSSVHGIFPGKNTGLGCHFFLQGIFPTQRLNPDLLCFLHWQAVFITKPFGKPHVLHILILNNYSLFIWNSSLTRCVFYLATLIKHQWET